MRTRLKSFLFLTILGITAVSYGQSITVGGSITGATEASIQAGSHTITVDLDDDTWVAASVGVNGPLTASLIDGITSSAEAAEWDAVRDLIKGGDNGLSNVTIPDGADIVTITIPTKADFSITEDITLSITVPGTLITGGALSDNDFATITEITPSIAVTGDFTSASEAAIQAGSHTMTVTITEATWDTNIGTDGNDTEDFLDGITGLPTPSGWDALLSDIKDSDQGVGNVSLAGDVVTITVPQKADFDITEDITLSFTAPGALITDHGALSDNDFVTITEITPSIAVTGDFTSASEAAIQAGSRTMTVTITEASWDTDIGTDGPDTENFLDGITGLPTPSGWDALLSDIKDSDQGVGNVSLAGDVVTITVPQKADFDITEDITLSFTAPGALITDHGALSDNDFVTITEITPSIAVTGDFTSATEAAIQAGSHTMTVTITEATWDADIGTDGPDTENFLDGITGLPTPSGWDALLSDIKDSDQGVGNVSLAGDVVTITVPQKADFDITDDITLSFTAPGGLITDHGALSDNNFVTITQTAAAIQVAGTITGVTDETDIRGGSYTITVTISEATWDTDIGTNGNDTEDFLDGITSSPASTGWTALLSDIKGGDQGVGNVSLAGDVVTISVPAKPDFDITADITLSMTAPGALITGAGDLSDADFASIDAVPTYVTAGGTITTVADEGDLRGSDHTITVALTGDTWVSGVGSNGPLTESLLDGITSDPSLQGWTDMLTLIKDTDQGVANVSTPSGGIVTITVPTKIDFNITDDIDLSVDVPASLIVASAVPLSDADFASIDSIGPSMLISSVPLSPIENEVDNTILTVKLFEETFIDGSFNDANFTLISTPNTPELRIDATSAYTAFGNDSLTIGIRLTGNITEDFTIGLTIGAAELTDGKPLTNSGSDVSVTSLLEPVITAVSIPDVPMGFGVTPVTATITVTDDETNVFTFVQGTIADRALTNLQRINNTTYTIDFVISELSNPEYTAGQVIPVTNLQLNNGVAIGNIFSYDIDNADDPIDTERPEVDLIDFNNGSYKVGDEIIAIIHATESGLTFDEAQTTINNIPLSAGNVSSNESASGIYQLIYTVVDGNDDVINPATIDVDVVMNDYVGNENAVYSTVSGVSPEIDAHLPVITSASVVNTGIQVPGDVIDIDVVSAEQDLNLGAGSHVNGVSTIGTGEGEIILVDNNDNTYTLSYKVGPDDMEVANYDEMLTTIILEDDFGNKKETSTLDVNDVQIVTSTPVANIYGGGELCPGDSVRININIVGVEPFNLKIFDGVSTTLDTVAPTENFSFIFKPVAEDTYDFTITEVEDDLGVKVPGIGTAQVILHGSPTPAITTARTAYQVTEEEGVLLSGSPAGGVFSGPGVVSSESKFYPNVAGLGLDQTLYYEFTDNNGCPAVATKDFDVVEAQATLIIPDTICYNGPATLITGNNLTGGPGTFTLFEIIGNYSYERPAGISDSDPFDDQALIHPDQIGGGVYRVQYNYLYQDSIPDKINESFILDFIEEVKFYNQPDVVCNDVDPIYLESNLNNTSAIYSFYIDPPNEQGVTGNEASGYYFNPQQATLGYNVVNFEFESRAGCLRQTSYGVINYDVPVVEFTPKEICIPIEGGPIGFNNLTDKPGLVSEWRWEFGDVNSGVFNTDTLYSADTPIHDYTAPGSRDISLEVRTVNGCITQYETTVVFGDKPITDFRWISDCFVNDAGVDFINESFSERDWESFEWKFRNKFGVPLGDTVTTAREDIEYIFDSQDSYYITLIAKNDLLCTDTLTKELILKETRTLGNFNYLETFDVDAGRWSTDQDSLSIKSNWTYAEPDFNGFEATPDDYGWYTNLTPPDERDDDEDYDERSWIQSPCFDFRDTERPMIRLDIMGSFDDNRDGAVLQYTLNDGEEWVTLGNISEGINWYNSFDIKEKPGGDDGSGNIGSNIGWSGGESFSPDTSWVSAAHDLDELIGEETVIFGIFYATDGASVVNNQGFAVDNIYIGERTKRALIEHFTNSGDQEARIADSNIDTFTIQNTLDVTNLQYHIHYPGIDPMNENNSAPASSRSFFYGISGVPYALMDGGIKPSYHYDFVQTTPTDNQLKELTLESPYFELKVIFQLHSERLATTVDIKALQDLDSSDLILNVAVVEKQVSAYTGTNGDTEFSNVVLSMLPSPAGTLISHAWEKDQKVSMQLSWTYGEVEDYADLMIVAFVQDRESGKVLQVASEDVSEHGMEAVLHKYKSLKVYPNPAYDQLNVEFGEARFGDVVLEVTDMTGRTVMAYELTSGEQFIQLDIEHLNEGAYILQSKENGKISSRTNFIKVR